MHRALVHVADALRRRSDGRIELRVRHSVSAPEPIPFVRENGGEIAMVSASGLSRYHPPLAAFEAPYMFRDLDHFYMTFDAPIGRDLLSAVEHKARVHVIRVWHQGIREVTLRDQIARTPEEFAEITLRVPAATQFVEAARVLGALPTTMPFESIAIGLRAGLVDGQENPLPTIKAMGFDRLCRYLILTHHMIGTIAPIVSLDYWTALSPADRDMIESAFVDGGLYNRLIIEEAERELVEAFAEGGMTVVEPELAVFRQRASASWRRFEDLWGPDLVGQIQAVH